MSADPRANSSAMAALGHEARIQKSDHAALKLWLRMLSCTTQIEDEIRKRLRVRFGISLSRFDYLAQLHRHRDGLKMRDLSRYLMVTGGNITGITDQLEAEGLVKRAPHPSDRRAFAVQLTPTGRRQFRRMAAVHEQWVIELFAGWNADEKSQVYALLAGLKTHLASVDTTAVKRKSKEKT